MDFLSSCALLAKTVKTSKRVKGFSEVNVRGVLLSQPVGRAGLETFCGVMNLPDPPNKSINNNIQASALCQKCTQ